jgi:hypothetical protein
MKTTKPTLILTLTLIAAPLTAIGSPEEDFSLEPCINGSVSASGQYATQALEDAAIIRATQTLDVQ